MYHILPTISSPQDLGKLDQDQLKLLSEEIRQFLIENVASTGGHLGPNLGIVELTLGIHRVFDSPRDKVIFDTGHQSYVHKLLTGRQNFETLRTKGGLSGYPSRSESEHDIVESSHASSSLSWADGMGRALDMQKGSENSPFIITMIGDGALTGGMAWEALNNIASRKDGKVVIVVNDNGRSYAPTVGGLADYLAKMRKTFDKFRTEQRYEDVMDRTKEKLQTGGQMSQFVYKSLHATKKGVKDWWAPQGMFEDLGLKYIGPIDGHSQEEVDIALQQAKKYRGPVIVHALTEKGHGYRPATEDTADHFHAVGVIDPETGTTKKTKSNYKTFTEVFEDEIVDIARERADIIGITAAMLAPVGFTKFKDEFPERVFDVGIAEQHAVTSAAGMAYAGLHPVVALYSTFLNRAFDQLLMDVALHKAGVTFILDRAGVTGPDGASHHGQWDLSLLQVVPNICVASPRDDISLQEQLREAVEISDRPTVLRYSKGPAQPRIECIERLSGKLDVLARTPNHQETTRDVLIVSIGSMATLAQEVNQKLDAQGISSEVIDPRWIFPISQELTELTKDYRLVVVLEDAVKVGGVGSRLRSHMRSTGIDTGVNEVGLPAEFLEHGTREEILEEQSITAQDIARDITEQVLGSKVPQAKPNRAVDTSGDEKIFTEVLDSSSHQQNT